MKKLFVVLAAILFLAIMACSSSSGSGTSTPTQPITFTSKSDIIVTSKTVAQTGGTIAAGNTGTPIDGIVVTFPAGALPADTTISLGYNTGTLTPNAGTYAGVALLLNTGNVTQFDQPVSITVPFTDISKVPIPYYVDSSGKLHLMQLIAVDRTAKTFTFQTFHASWYTWIFGETPGSGNIIDTGFVPGNDGFQITNFTNEYKTGRCLGMTAFSNWYFMNKKVSKGNFFPKYYGPPSYPTFKDNSGNSITGQDIIATRAFTSVSLKNSNKDYYEVLAKKQGSLAPDDRLNCILNPISNGNPVLIGLWQSNGTAGHSVLAYAYNASSGTIFIYDPNYPGDKTRTITYNTTSKIINAYTSGKNIYDGIGADGDGSYRLGEDYQNILDDADAKFSGSGHAVINLTSPINGQQIMGSNVTLSGNIQSGEVLVTKLVVLVGVTPFPVDVGEDGNFSLTVSLASGINQLVFRTEGLTEVSVGVDLLDQLVSMGNNMGTTIFTLNSISSTPYSMSGTIHVGSNSGVALSGATVSIAGLTATTSSTGTFSITGIPAGTYAFSVSKSGYDTYTNSAYYIGSDQTGLNFYLTQSSTSGDYTSPNIGILKYVPAGSFQRDATSTNISTVSAFRMSQYEITRAQFLAIMGTDPSLIIYSSGIGDPVQQANWYHAIAFCNKLSIAEGLTPVYSVSGINFTTLTYAEIPTAPNATWNAATDNWSANGYRLPTEMEWMWAAMGATSDGRGADIVGGVNTGGYTKGYAGSIEAGGAQVNIGDYAWTWENSTSTTHPVGTKLPNELGLYDMSGNVWEWCWDWYADNGTWPYYAITETVTDYRGAASGAYRVARGGSWFDYASNATVAYRYNCYPDHRPTTFGFRVVRP